jgi:hypothetical protein
LDLRVLSSNDQLKIDLLDVLPAAASRGKADTRVFLLIW